jgi:hypothetical protein
MTKDEDLSVALGLVTVRIDSEDQPEDEVADREEHRRMIQSPTPGDRNDDFRPLQVSCREVSGAKTWTSRQATHDGLSVISTLKKRMPVQGVAGACRSH